jgi:hypothetical protein
MLWVKFFYPRHLEAWPDSPNVKEVAGSDRPKGNGVAVSSHTRIVVWTRGGGRCHFCNRALLGDLLTGKDELNCGFIAHIVAESAGGPRGAPDRSLQLADDPANLMLLCNEHHRAIDHPQHWRDYPERDLLRVKAEHERRVELVTGIRPEYSTHILLYAAKVGEHDCPSRYDLAKNAVLPGRYPAVREPITLSLAGSTFADHEPEFWAFQLDNLRRQFARRVRDRLADGDIKHLSVFALAPQPLLIELGRLLSDVPAVAIHQLHREPQGWDWRSIRQPLSFELHPAATAGKQVALAISLSATVSDERITAVLGDVPIWRLTVERPHNDMMHREDDLSSFRRVMRETFDRIKVSHGQDASIHLFPAMPVSAAIEVGRTWMPKADLPLVIYDENRARGGFEARLRIGKESPPPKELSDA